MEFISSILSQDTLTGIGTIVSALIAIANVITMLCPSVSSNKIYNLIMKLLNVVSLNVLKNKNADDASSTSVSKISKVSILFLVFLIFTGCGGRSIIVTVDQDVNVDSLGIDVTSQIVDVAFNSYSTVYSEKDSLTFASGVALAIKVVPQLISSVKEYKTAVAEVMYLSDDEILALVSIGDNYDLGVNAEKIKQVFKTSLFIVQTYFLFYNDSAEDEEAFYNSLDKLVIQELSPAYQ